MRSLVWVEHDNTEIAEATLSAVTAAAQLGDVELLVVGLHIAKIADAASRIAGVQVVHVADGESLKECFAEAVAAVVVSLMDGLDAFVAPTTANGKNIAPRAAALLDVMQLTDVISVLPERTFCRAVYAGNAIVTLRSRDRKLVLTVRPAAFAKAAREGSAAEIALVPPPAAIAGVRLIERTVSSAERPDLASAKIVVSGGRALQSGEKFQALLGPLADKLGAAIGASRAAVDAGWLPNHFQIGQTGKIVAPDLYIAIGISGAIQHLAGMKEAKAIIAINNDGDAPIFDYADIGLVADIFEAVPALTAKL
jgi:electron transfer flavoprotein alpha subunit